MVEVIRLGAPINPPLQIHWHITNATGNVPKLSTTLPDDGKSYGVKIHNKPSRGSMITLAGQQTQMTMGINRRQRTTITMVITTTRTEEKE